MSTIKIFSISDIHFGHRRNNIEYMYNNFKKFLISNAVKIKEADIVIVAGDVYDRLFNSSSIEFKLATKALTTLIDYCIMFNTRLRILEGTPSHDWKQAKILYNIINDLKLTNLDFKYIDNLEIEIINELDELSILYIPDEIDKDYKRLEKKVSKLIEERGLTQVDISVIHGGFEFNLPEYIGHHDSEFYSKITKGVVIAGHIHRHEIKDNIVVVGPFDRLTHADEKEKGGGVFIEYDKSSNEKSIKHVVNAYATTFLTINADKNDFKKIINIIKPHVKKDKVFIRLEGSNINDMVNELKRLFPNITFSIKSNNKEENNDIRHVEIKKLTDKIVTKEDILDYIKSRVNDKVKYNKYVEIIEEL